MTTRVTGPALDYDLDEDDIFNQIDDLTAGQKQLKLKVKPLIVLDAQNVAMRHGQDAKFSCKGIIVAVRYWQKNGHKVICFLPDYLFDYSEVGKQKKLMEMGIKAAKAQKIPDSVATLNQLRDLGVMVSTPSQDYDDSYCISYARHENAFIVTNDKFRDYERKL